MRWLICGLLLLAPTVVHADRYGRGLILFTQGLCARCHTVGWREPVKAERKLIDLTRITAQRSEKELREWMENPYQAKPDSGCAHRHLEREDVDALLAFLRLRAEAEPGRVQSGSGGGVTIVGGAAPAPQPARSPIPLRRESPPTAGPRERSR